MNMQDWKEEEKEEQTNTDDASIHILQIKYSNYTWIGSINVVWI